MLWEMPSLDRPQGWHGWPSSGCRVVRAALNLKQRISVLPHLVPQCTTEADTLRAFEYYMLIIHANSRPDLILNLMRFYTKYLYKGISILFYNNKLFINLLLTWESQVSRCASSIYGL